MSADVLGPAMIAAIAEIEDKTDRNAIFRAMAGAIITHIQSAGVVNTTVTGTSATGGPVVGTGVGTVS